MEHEAPRSDEENTPDIEESVEFSVPWSTHENEFDNDPAREIGKVAIEEEVVLPAPDGWKTISRISDDTKVAYTAIQRVAERYRQEHPDWFASYMYLNKNGVPIRKAEHYSPELIEEVTKVLFEHSKAPKGWMTQLAAAADIGVAPQTLAPSAERYRNEHPEWFADYKNIQGRVFEHYSPDLITILRTTLSGIDDAPSNWRTNTRLSRELKASQDTISGIADTYRTDHPEWFHIYKAGSGQAFEHYHPELIAAIDRALVSNRFELPPEGWESKGRIAKNLGVGPVFLAKIADTYHESNPEWFGRYLVIARGTGKAQVPGEHYHPELVLELRKIIEDLSGVPDGWKNPTRLSSDLKVGYGLIRRIAESYRDVSPEWFKEFIAEDQGRNRPLEYYSPELIKHITDEVEVYEFAPKDWMTIGGIADQAGVTHKVIANLSESYRQTNPEWFMEFRSERGMLYEYIHPDGVRCFLGTINSKKEDRSDKLLVDNLSLRVEAIKNGGGDISFQSLIGLFGAESALDILYQQHPEYRKLPVPYVKSMIGEYLGDFMMAKGEFSLEGLEKGAVFLSTPAFKDRLTEVVKMDCLQMLNHLGRMSLDDVNAVAVTEYLEEIRQKSAHIDSPELEEILGEVEAYYTLLFNDIHKPDHFIDQLGDNRLFPDINQRINVQELLFKHKILIADEMGTGKSASAIMAKEIIGAKQALVVVPSNVVSVWENYLSDKTDGDKQLGYFKEGRAPNVLIVNSLDDLTNVNGSEYDYIIISQERLNDSYTDALETLDYDMMIVDEMHKLKNISSGKRSNNLIRLAERVDGNDKYLALLSGTPVPNKVGDVALTLKLLYPHDFADIDNKQLTSQILNGDVLDLRSRLVMRTQMKSLTENIDMPEMKQETEKIHLSDYERDIYDILLEEDELTASEKLALLRKFTLNPRMLDATPDVVGAKVEHVGSILRESFRHKDKIVMFVNGYIEGVIRGEDTIVPDLQLPEDVEVRSIHGDVSKQERLEIQQQLQTHDKKILLLVSGQTADTGVDFSGADEVFHYNEPWSLYDKQQQTARVYRPGLENNLTVRTFVTEGTLEEGINRYIEKKYLAIEKLLRGIPISDIEKNMLAQSEKTVDPNAEVSPELAKYYFSSQDKMARIYGYVKEIGEDKFLEFLSKYGQDYANAYADLTGARSYQANMARLSGSVIKNMIDSQGKAPHDVRILDLASGPEILQRHVVDELSGSVYSLDINPRHFTQPGKKMTGSVSKIPVADGAVDYVNLSLGLHYTRWAPSRGSFERLETLMEINRVLPVGGRATIGMIHSLKLDDSNELRDALGKLGFKVINEYTGNVSNGKSFDTQLLTLEKTTHIIDDAATLAGVVDAKALKFTKNEAGLSETRKIATRFSMNGAILPAHLNSLDQKVLEEEEESILQMETLQKNYGGIERIPEDKIVSQGFSRVFNGKRYVLFRRLDTDPSAVLIR